MSYNCLHINFGWLVYIQYLISYLVLTIIKLRLSCSSTMFFTIILESTHILQCIYFCVVNKLASFRDVISLRLLVLTTLLLGKLNTSSTCLMISRLPTMKNEVHISLSHIPSCCHSAVCDFVPVIL